MITNLWQSIFLNLKRYLFSSQKIKSSLFYFSGMTSLVLADLFIVKYFPDTFVAEWAFLKSSLFIGGSILVFGLDQMFIRHNLRVSVYLKKFIRHVLIMAMVIAVIVYFRYSKMFITIIITLYALNQLLFGAARANFKYQLSQAILQSWKIIFLSITLIVYFFSLKANPYYFMVIAITIPIMLSIRPLTNLLKDGSHTDVPLKLLYQDAAFMFLSIISLNIAMYADQLFLKQFAQESDMVKLFTHTSSIYPLGIAFNGLAGFFLGPYLKKRPKTSIRKLLSILLLVAILLATSSFFVGGLILKFVRHTQMDISLSILLSMIIGLRILYILPSSYIGVIGSQKMLRIFVVICITGVSIQILGFLGLIKFTSINIVYAAVLSVIIHWLIRSFGGIISIFLFKDRKATH